MKIFPLQLLAPLQTVFFPNVNYFSLYISHLQTIYYAFLGPANNFLSGIFFIAPPPSLPRNNGPSLREGGVKERRTLKSFIVFYFF